jgi:hypothetical protein
MLSLSVMTQGLETLSIEIFDQNGGLITVGIVSLTDAKGKKVAQIELSKTKKTPTFNLNVGTYNLEIQAPGFKPLNQQIEVKKGNNNLEIRLELEDITVNIEVDQNEREKRLDEAIGGYLSQREIDSLPESGQEIKEELQRRYGDDILIRIDGDFDGSHIPSKSEISSIKVIRNTFDAEFHEIGRIIIDIRTNAITHSFRGMVNFSFNNSILNARNPFDLKRQTANSNNILAFMSGPLIKNKASFNLSTISFNRTTTQRFIGTGFNETVVPQKIGSSISITTFGIKHNLPKNRLLNFKYQNIHIVFKNLGLGAFDLPERGANRRNIQHKFTLIESGTFRNKYANDFTFEFSQGVEKTLPKSLETSILVLNAFNRGSAGANNRTDRTKFRIADNLLFDTKKHSLKLGGEVEFERLESISENNLNGTFTFLNLTDFNNGKPTQFSQTLGKTEYELSQLRTSFYFQDYFKLNQTLQLSLGMRYEWQNNVRDHNNFSPRLGYVWSPEKSGKFIVRGGIGIFYDWLDNGTLSSILSNDGRQGQKIIIRNPSYPNPFINGIVPQSLPLNISKLADNLVSPAIFVTQNGFNYKLDKSLTFEGTYTFKKGWHHFRSRNVNAPINGTHPNPTFGIIQLLESSGITQEHSFDLKINGYYRGINMFGNYQFGKDTADFSSPLSLPMDNYNLRLERGVSSLDQTHKLNLSFNFDLFKKINVSPSLRLESGFPYTITTGKDDNGDTVFNDRPNGIGRNTERGEWLQQVDLRFRWKFPMKYFGLKETQRRSLSFNTNLRNLLNTANLTNYVGIQTSPFFRKPTSARNPRSIEFGLSFGF